MHRRPQPSHALARTLVTVGEGLKTGVRGSSRIMERRDSIDVGLRDSDHRMRFRGIKERRGRMAKMAAPRAKPLGTPSVASAHQTYRTICARTQIYVKIRVRIPRNKMWAVCCTFSRTIRTVSFHQPPRRVVRIVLRDQLTCRSIVYVNTGIDERAPRSSKGDRSEDIRE